MSSSYVTESKLEELLDAQTKKFTSKFDEFKSYFTDHLQALLKPINEEISSLKSSIDTRDAEINTLKTQIATIQSTNNDLIAANKTLEARLSKTEKFQSDATASFQQLETKLEDRTNRQLRQTIVVKGLPEKKNEKWADTRNALAKYVSKAYQMDIKHAYGLFERVHRGGGDGFDGKKKGKRDIYALCRHWDDSEELVWRSYNVNKGKSKKDRIFIEYKYGPITTLRRGEALKRRKEVLDEKLYRNAYVKFPAILMGRKDGEDTYSVVADFSEAPVSKLPVLVSNDI